MDSDWDSTATKALLRSASQRLGQLQSQKDSKAAITRRDIATLLRNGDVALARAKGHNLVLEDTMSDLLEVLGMYLGVVLEHFKSVDQRMMNNPMLLEAVSSVIYAAEHVDCKELQFSRDALLKHLYSELGDSPLTNRDGHVPQKVLQAVSAPPPNAANLDQYLVDIAKAHGYVWVPEPRRQDIIDPLSEILDPSTAPVVDLPRLRTLCANGLPDEPSWLRPRIWKLFFGVLPVLKASWQVELRKQRDSYYDLVRRLLEPYATFPAPTLPLQRHDTAVLNASKQLSSIPPSLLGMLEAAPEFGPTNPLSPNANDEVRVSCAQNLDTRLAEIQSMGDAKPAQSATPEIRLESDDSSEPGSLAERRKKVPKVLNTAKTYAGLHDQHASVLLRILFIHSSINPGNISPHIPALLVPLYSIMNQEIEADDVAHIEADTFWVFTALISDFSELEDEEGGNIWMKKLGERLAWADQELADNMHAKGLDPSLPHYSYRWLAPLLTQTLPLPSVLLLWDALFSRERPSKNENPKLDYLVDFCAGMLIRARLTIFRLGKVNAPRSAGLWEEDKVLTPVSPVRAWELGDAFVQGVAFLSRYPVESAGGIERLLQSASDLSNRRINEAKRSQGDSRGFGVRLGLSVWKGITNQMPSPIASPDTSDEEDANTTDEENTEVDEPADTEPSNGITSRFASSVWRGITNQSDTPPATPISAVPRTPPRSPTMSETTASPPGESRASSLWKYAKRLQDSDAAANLAKASSNWRARGLLSPWGGSDSGRSTSPNSPVLQPIKEELSRRGSLPVQPHDHYTSTSSPPSFRAPRDSLLFAPGEAPHIPTPDSPMSDSGVLGKARHLQQSLAALTHAAAPAPPKPKTGPKPLLLGAGSSSVVTPASNRHRQSKSSIGQWAEMIGEPQPRTHHRDSQSSMSSLSPSDALGLGHSRQASDSNPRASRIVPLNRRSVSPMAPGARTPDFRTAGFRESMSSVSSSDRGNSSPKAPSRGWGRSGYASDSPSLASPPPRTPVTLTNGAIVVTNGDDAPVSDQLDSDVDSISRLSAKISKPSEDDQVTLHGSSSLSRGSRKVKPRSPRPPDLHIEGLKSNKVAEQSPNSLHAGWANGDQDARTPKAADFDGSESSASPRDRNGRDRKLSSDTISPRLRKGSTGSTETRPRKLSSSRRKVPEVRDSDAEKGDDELDDLLSAYDSETSLQGF
ncbi:regulator of Vps4 activity in the MVB pathway-domain-containing protein [Flagelloscypha sp. PMI_526]|nr:regulator of Vps4 activity in the MVB pathway-domain-containing protein [Flagelloscypha sp. PMI_526]